MTGDDALRVIITAMLDPDPRRLPSATEATTRLRAESSVTGTVGQKPPLRRPGDRPKTDPKTSERSLASTVDWFEAVWRVMLIATWWPPLPTR